MMVNFVISESSYFDNNIFKWCEKFGRNKQSFIFSLLPYAERDSQLWGTYKVESWLIAAITDESGLKPKAFTLRKRIKSLWLGVFEVPMSTIISYSKM